jgi:hypothetical protein
MKNIHVLPTDNPSRLCLSNNSILTIIEEANYTFSHIQSVNIYITSDEEIKEGDWYINTFVSEREQKPQTHTEKKQLINHQKDYRFKYCKKIILTTDFNLAPDVQKIDDDFLEWFVKNPSCEEVEVYNDKNVGYEYDHYSIIIPKEEQKQHLIDIMEKDEELGLYDIENDWDKILEEYYDQPKLNFISLNKWLKENYEIPKKKMGTKEEIKLEDIFNYEKRRGVKDLIDAHKQDDENYLDSFGVTKTQFEVYRNFNKQETLEEAAIIRYGSDPYLWAKQKERDGFIEGAKWQQERMYSEEDLFKILLDFVAFPHEYMEPRSFIIERYLKELKNK